MFCVTSSLMPFLPLQNCDWYKYGNNENLDYFFFACVYIECVFKNLPSQLCWPEQRLHGSVCTWSTLLPSLSHHSCHQQSPGRLQPRRRWQNPLCRSTLKCLTWSRPPGHGPQPAKSKMIIILISPYVIAISRVQGDSSPDASGKVRCAAVLQSAQLGPAHQDTVPNLQKGKWL